MRIWKKNSLYPRESALICAAFPVLPGSLDWGRIRDRLPYLTGRRTKGLRIGMQPQMKTLDERRIKKDSVFIRVKICAYLRPLFLSFLDARTLI